MKTCLKLIPSQYDQLILETLLIEAKGTAKGIIQISHGMCEHKERYLPFIEFLSDAGYHCIIHDHRGHGKSIERSEDLGYFYGGGAKALVEDVHQLTVYAKEKWPGLQVVLFGHSMGSLIARNYIKKYDNHIQALIICGSPSKHYAVGAGMVLAKIQRMFLGGRHPSRLLEIVSFAQNRLKFKDEPSRSSWTCSDPEVVKEYDDSSLCGFVFTVDAYQGLFTLMKETYGKKGWKCQNPALPILFIGGEEDPCIGTDDKFIAAMKHLKKMGYGKVTGKRYPGMRHEILNEIGKEKVFRNVVTYINTQCRNTRFPYSQYKKN